MLRKLNQARLQREVFERTQSIVKGRWALLHLYAATWPSSRCLLRRALSQSQGRTHLYNFSGGILCFVSFDDGLLGPDGLAFKSAMCVSEFTDVCAYGCGDVFAAA